MRQLLLIGSGKTHTLIGKSGGDNSGEGIIFRSIRHVFSMVSAGNRDVSIRVSCLEIYKDKTTDLLVTSKERNSLQLREHPKYGFFVDGLILEPCGDAAKALSTVAQSLRERHVGSHDRNERSSRSHCVIAVHADSLPRDVDSSPPTYGSLSLVDLAGSERPKETGSAGAALREAGHINKSLYTLGEVIKAMVKKGPRASRSVVPFRDSVLTKLLIGSLGGNCKTLMFANISPESHHVAETLRTLNFASQVKCVVNRPVVQLDPREKVIHELRREIDSLREENNLLRKRLESAPTALADRDDDLVPDRNARLAHSWSAGSPASTSTSMSAHAQSDSQALSSSGGENKAPQLPSVAPPLQPRTTRIAFQADLVPAPLPSLARLDVVRGDAVDEMEDRMERELEEMLSRQLEQQIYGGRSAPVQGAKTVNPVSLHKSAGLQTFFLSQPALQANLIPNRQPTLQPDRQPTLQPNRQPALQPDRQRDRSGTDIWQRRWAADLETMESHRRNRAEGEASTRILTCKEALMDGSHPMLFRNRGQPPVHLLPALLKSNLREDSITNQNEMKRLARSIQFRNQQGTFMS
jgi:hypothetical protein